MKYTIHGFSQKVAIAMNLKSDELLLLRWFVDFMGTNKMRKFFLGEECFYWVKYDAILEDLPILDCKKRAVASKFKNLVDAEVLKNETLKQGGTYSVYAIGEKYESLISEIGGCCSNNKGVAVQTTTGCGKTNKGVAVETTTGCCSNDKGVAVQTAYKDLSSIDPSTNLSIKTTEEKKGGVSAKQKTADIFDQYDFPPVLLEKTKDWLEYKKEKGQGYKPKGLENLLTQILHQYQEYGESAVVAVISESMANNWQGIIWDKLRKPQQSTPTKGQNSSGKKQNRFVNFEQRDDYDFGAIEEFERNRE